MAEKTSLNLSILWPFNTSGVNVDLSITYACSTTGSKTSCAVIEYTVNIPHDED